jgi:hypothetical protein
LIAETDRPPAIGPADLGIAFKWKKKILSVWISILRGMARSKCELETSFKFYSGKLHELRDVALVGETSVLAL